MNHLPKNGHGVLSCHQYDREQKHCCCLEVQFQKDKPPSYQRCTVFLELATNLRHVEQSNHVFHNLGKKGQQNSRRYSNIEPIPHTMLQVSQEAKLLLWRFSFSFRTTVDINRDILDLLD